MLLCVMNKHLHFGAIFLNPRWILRANLPRAKLVQPGRHCVVNFNMLTESETGFMEEETPGKLTCHTFMTNINLQNEMFS